MHSSFVLQPSLQLVFFFIVIISLVQPLHGRAYCGFDC